jgi:hypothetical protein
MEHHQTDDHNDSWLDGAPTWVRVVQAVLIGPSQIWQRVVGWLAG